jgi:hypothetical protein
MNKHGLDASPAKNHSPAWLDGEKWEEFPPIALQPQ